MFFFFADTGNNGHTYARTHTSTGAQNSPGKTLEKILLDGGKDSKNKLKIELFFFEGGEDKEVGKKSSPKRKRKETRKCVCVRVCVCVRMFWASSHRFWLLFLFSSLARSMLAEMFSSYPALVRELR